jgi:WhiB family redox-sensing transcriptional regulator
VMFPELGKSSKHARAICARCPVTAECLEYVVGMPVCPPCGVWAGLTERQILKVRLERKTATRDGDAA